MKVNTGENCRERTNLVDFFQIAQSRVFEKKDVKLTKKNYFIKRLQWCKNLFSTSDLSLSMLNLTEI